MSKISELLPKAGLLTKSNDLFVTVDVEAGDLGTKNITRKELVNAIQQEDFTSISVTGGDIANVIISNSSFDSVDIINPTFSNLPSLPEAIENEDFFLLKNTSDNELASFTWQEMTDSIADEFQKSTKVYISEDGYSANTANGSYMKPYNTLEDGFAAAQRSLTPVAISVLPGNYYTRGNLALPDDCSVVSTNGQYATNVIMQEGYEVNNCFLVGSGCYVQGFAFIGQQVDNFDDPTKGFAVGYRPGATILRSPYIRDSSQISNYRRNTIAAPLNPVNTLGTITDLGGTDHPNALVGRGGGMLIADRSLLNPNSIFPYMLAFGATPRSPNGLGYVAKNGAGINGIGSITIFQRCAFFALNGGQLTLNNSGTQFGDISMRSKGSTFVVDPYEVSDTSLMIVADQAATDITAVKNATIDYVWDALVADLGYQGYDSVKCKRDIGYILQGVSRDITLDTNYWAIVNGNSYRRAYSALVISDQLTQTTGGIVYARDAVAELLTDTPSITKSNASFNETIDILVNGTGNADILTFADPGVPNQVSARTQLLENKSLIIDSVISWIGTNFPSLSFNTTTCIRDTGYIIDALAHDLNYGGNLATIVNAEAYFVGASSQLPEDQKLITAASIEYLGTLCGFAVLGTLPEQNVAGDVATNVESLLCTRLVNIISKVIRKNTLGALAIAYEPDLTWVASNYTASKELIDANAEIIKTNTTVYINLEYNFIDENFTRRDSNNLLTSIIYNFQSGNQSAIRNYSAGFFNYNGRHVFRVFNPTAVGLTYIDTLFSIAALDAAVLLPNINDAYIVASVASNYYAGNIYYWDGTNWVNDGANDTSVLDAFVYSYGKMEEYIVNNVTLSTPELVMLNELFILLRATLLSPKRLQFGSLIESIGHQFNLAGAGVNTNALPLNFRRVGEPLAASGSVLQEDNGRVRWSGADELNNQYFARGLKINGRTGKLEGRPFTSSVRRLARRAANSRTTL
jgi:hypothetical protein